MQKNQLPPGFTNPQEFAERLMKEPESDWQKRGEQMALRLFHEMAHRVPAYKEFLRTNQIESETIRSIKDFRSVPLIDKDNYLRKYPRNMLSWDGDFASGGWTISTTSGSTGEPFYFPRQNTQDMQYAMMAAQYLNANFDIKNNKTLYIVAFPMGAWIGGVFTYEALQLASVQEGYDLSIITPGINKLAVIDAVKQLADDYDQVIIGSYAPFLKDILDDGARMGVDWKAVNVGFVFSAEAFSEELRDYVAEVVGLSNILKGTLNHYGTVDLGTMSHETSLSILARREIFSNKKIVDAIFPEEYKQPTLTQYIPELFYFESEGNNLICSAYSGLPLVRYDLKDYGGLIGKEELETRLLEHNVDLQQLVKKNEIADTEWNLPYVFVYERNDFSVSYYAFLVYPDTIRRALLKKKYNNVITGKFTMNVDYSKKGNQELWIHVEMKHGAKESRKLNKRLTLDIHESLVHENSEYRETYSIRGESVKPIVKFWEYEDDKYFKPGTKQKWVTSSE